MLECRRCSTIDVSNANVELVGGFQTILCIPCLNLWRKHIKAHEIFQELQTIEDNLDLIQLMINGRAYLDTAQGSRDASGTLADRYSDEFLRLRRVQREMLRRLLDVGEAFVNA